MKRYIVLCYGKDGNHYLVGVTAYTQAKALDAVERNQNPHQILAITNGESTVKGNTTFKGVLQTVNPPQRWIIGGSW